MFNMTTRIPKEHEDAMIAAYLNGATQEQAAALFGYGRKTCARILKQRGIPIRSIVEVCRIPKEHEDAMIAAYLAGVTQGEAAAFFGYNGTICSNVLKRRKIPMRTASEAHRIPKEHEDIMIAAYLKGATQEEAARSF